MAQVCVVRGLAVGIVGALVLALAAAGLAVGWLREGPRDVEAMPAFVAADVSGTLGRRPAGTTVGGLCPVPPCEPRTSVELVLAGLPALPYVARLEGASSAVDLGPLLELDGAHGVDWEAAEDHGDKDTFVLAVAGRDVARHPVVWPQGTGTLRVGWELVVGWGAAPAHVHLNEVGAVTVSTVALAELDEAPPAGLEFRAALRDGPGLVDLGTFETQGGRSVLDGRVERVRLADHDRVVVVLVVEGRATGEGLPVLEGAF